jgi:hypothetical protein
MANMKKVDRKLQYDSRESNYFCYGYCYYFKPLYDFEKYIIATPLKESDGLFFGNCIVTDLKGLRIDFCLNGIVPLSADICEAKRKLSDTVLAQIENIKG